MISLGGACQAGRPTCICWLASECDQPCCRLCWVRWLGAPADPNVLVPGSKPHPACSSALVAWVCVCCVDSSMLPAAVDHAGRQAGSLDEKPPRHTWLLVQCSSKICRYLHACCALGLCLQALHLRGRTVAWSSSQLQELEQLEQPVQVQTWQQTRLSWLDPRHHLQACCWCVLAVVMGGL